MLWVDAGGYQFYDSNEVLPLLDLGRERFKMLQSISELTIGDSSENSNVSVTLNNSPELTQLFQRPPINAQIYQFTGNNIEKIFDGRIVSCSIANTIQMGFEA